MGSPTAMRIRLRGNSLNSLTYGRMTSCAPHWAIGYSGRPDVRASRTAPVLAAMGHRPSSRVIVPSGYTTTHSPFASAASASLIAAATSGVLRYTGI